MRDVSQPKLVLTLAAELKRQHVVAPPDWASFVKTGHHRERPPVDEDWWYSRAASVLRTVYLRGPVGTAKLRVRYGGRKNRGMNTDRFFPAGGNHLRKILQQLEAAKLVKQEMKGVHKGRVITPLGRKLLHAVANVVKAEAASTAQGAVAGKAESAKAEPPAQDAAGGQE
jgi:small subunit ribosomal protein S19e